MSLPAVFQPFAEAKPICVMARGILERFLAPQPLDDLFHRTAQRQYTRDLLFSTTVELMAQVVLGRKPSVYAAYRALEDRIPVSDQAIYDKLQHMELAVSQGLVQDSASRAAALLHALGAVQPPWLAGYHTKILDGNHLEATEHRIAELRTTSAAPLPGKGLVILDQPTRTVTDILLTEDGQAQERSLLADVLGRVESRDLWIADRNICTLNFLLGVAAKNAFFVIRQHGQLQGKRLGKRKARGRCATGKVFEQRLRLRRADGKELVVRRVTVELDRPTQDGDTEIHILTNLPVKEANAAKVAELYRKRWTIEGLFLEVAETLACEIKTLAYPKAALFAFCVGLLATNAVAVLKGAIRAVHGEKAAGKLSGYYLALEIRETYEGMMVAVPPEKWVKAFGKGSDEAVAEILKEIAGHVKLARYRKTPRGPKKKPQRTQYRNGEHVATSKILEARKSRK